MSVLWLETFQFLCRVITHAVTAASPSTVSVTGSSTVSSSACNKWPALVMKLAGPLHVDIDSLRRHHVVELYLSGADKLAQEVINTCDWLTRHHVVELFLSGADKLAQEVAEHIIYVISGSVNRLVNNYTTKLVKYYQLQTVSFVRDIVLFRECTLELSNRVSLSLLELDQLVHVASTS